MKANLYRIGAFLAVCLLSAFIAWCGGYDFNERSAPVGVWAMLTLWCALAVSSLAGFFA